jgi:hypothetical protein
MIAPQ